MAPRRALAVALALVLVTAGCGLGPQGAPTPTATPTSNDVPAPTATATPEPERDWSIPRAGATDAPADGRAASVTDRASLPRLYRQHRRATADATYAVEATYRVHRDGEPTERVTVHARRGTEATVDGVSRFYRGRDYGGDGTARRVRTTATYRTATTGPTLYYRNVTAGDEVLRKESGTLQGVPTSAALRTAPWRYRDLAVRLAAAGQLDDGEAATVGGVSVTRYRVSGVDRAAFDALAVEEGDAGLRMLAGRSPDDADPTEYRGTVAVDDAGRIRQVNLTLAGTRYNESYEPVPTTVRVRARLSAVGETRVADDPPRWVERTPRLWVRPMAEPGVALAVDHRGGPTVDVYGSIETRSTDGVTAFPLLVRDPLPPGETLHVYLYPDDDGNEMEAGTALGDRPSGPFVRANLSAMQFDSSPDGLGSEFEHAHYVGVNRTGPAAD